MSSSATFNSIVTAEMAADSRGDFFLEMAASLLSSQAYGSTWALASCWLAAYLLYICPPDDAAATGIGAGPVVNRKAGDVSQSWGLLQMQQLTAQDAGFATNKYGQMFLFIRNTRAAAGPTTTQTSCGNPTGANWPGSAFGGVW